MAMDAAIRVAGFARGISTAPALIRHRSDKCSAVQAFGQAVSTQEAREKESIERGVRVLRVDGEWEQLATELGDFWIPKRDYYAFIEELAEQKEDGYRMAGRVGPDDVVLDCGANVGVVTRRALLQGAAIVVAIDPGPSPLACLRRTFAREIASGRVILAPKGVWDKDDVLPLTSSDRLASSASSVALDRGLKGPSIELTTIDHIVADLKLTRVDFIKMDIEGAEPNALRGAAATLARFRPRLAISLEHRPTDPDQLPALIHALRPDYALVCGPCTNIAGSVQPSAVYGN